MNEKASKKTTKELAAELEELRVAVARLEKEVEWLHRLVWLAVSAALGSLISKILLFKLVKTQ